MYRTLKQFLRQHFWAFLAAAICGLILFLPQIWLMKDAGPEYKGIAMSEVDNDHYYLSRIAAAYRGDLKITQASMFGTADMPYTSPPLAEDTVAGLARLLRLTPAEMQFFGYFLFPFLLGLIFYFLAWKVTGSKLVAILTPLGIILGSSIVMDFHQVQYLFSELSRLWINVYNRPIHPQVSSIYFYGWLTLFYANLVRPSKYKLVASGVLLGLLFYVYPYSWTVAVTLLGLYIVFSFVKKNFPRGKNLLFMLGIGLAVSSGYWINYWQLAHQPLFPLIREHFVIYTSHEFSWSNLLFVDFLVLAVFFWRKLKDEKFYFFLFMFLALLTVINQQVITGIRMFPGHWHWYYIVPFSIFFLVYAALTELTRRALHQAFAFFAIVFLILFSYAAQYQYYLRYKDQVLSYQRFGPVYEWLSTNAVPGSVVVADDKFSERLSIYAPLYHYTWQGADELYLITNERIKHGFFTKLYLQSVGSENLDEHINAGTSELQILLSLYYRRYAQNCVVCHTQEEIETLKQEYLEFLDKDFRTELNRYQVNYAVWDSAGSFESFEKFAFMELVAEINDMRIYKVN